jgi:hypothetical protein
MRIPNWIARLLWNADYSQARRRRRKSRRGEPDGEFIHFAVARLEERRVLNGTLVIDAGGAVTYNAQPGANDNSLQISVENNQYTFQAGPGENIQVDDQSGSGLFHSGPGNSVSIGSVGQPDDVTSVTVNMDDGADAVTVVSAEDPLTINGGAGDDLLTIDVSAGLIARPITFHGGSQTTSDELRVVGGGTVTTAANVTHTFINNNDGTLAVDGMVINYTGLEPVTLQSITPADVLLEFSSGAETITVTDAGGGQTMVDSTLGESFTFLNPTNSLAIFGGDGGGPLFELEPNDSRATAQNIDAAGWSLQNDPTIANSTTLPHVSIRGTGDGSFDYYSFTANAGDVAVFDIDAHNFDTELFLYDAAGNLLASNDNAVTALDAGDGSPDDLDSFLQHTFASSGTFVIGVGAFPSDNVGGAITGAAPQPGEVYTLHVSVANHVLNAGDNTVTISSVGAGFGASLFIDQAQTVNLNASITFAAGNDLIVSAGTINVGAAAALATSGTGSISLVADRNVLVGPGTALSTVDGGIDIEANFFITAAGDFHGIELDGAAVTTTGTGDIIFDGSGGQDAASQFHTGVRIHNGSTVNSTLTTADAGEVNILGFGGVGSAFQFGTLISGAGTEVVSQAGNISIEGRGGVDVGPDDGSLNFGARGVSIQQGAHVRSEGALVAADVTIFGVGGSGVANNHGVEFRDAGTVVSTVNGLIDIDATGGLGTRQAGAGPAVEPGAQNMGVLILSGALVHATGLGRIEIEAVGGDTVVSGGTGADSNIGVAIIGAGSAVRANSMYIEIIGMGGTGEGNFNFGVLLLAGGRVESTATADIFIDGVGGDGANANHGVLISGVGSAVISLDGEVNVVGESGGGASSIGVLLADAAQINATASGDVIIEVTGEFAMLTGSSISAVDGFVSITSDEDVTLGAVSSVTGDIEGVSEGDLTTTDGQNISAANVLFDVAADQSLLVAGTTSITATNDVTLVADEMTFAAGTAGRVQAGAAGVLQVRAQEDETQLRLGANAGPDVVGAGAAGILALDAVDLSALSFLSGTLQAGSLLARGATVIDNGGAPLSALTNLSMFATSLSILDTVDVGANTITLNATGPVTDDPGADTDLDVVAGTLNVAAVDSAGALGDELNLNVANLTIGSAAGDVFLTDADDIELAAINLGATQTFSLRSIAGSILDAVGDDALITAQTIALSAFGSVGSVGAGISAASSVTDLRIDVNDDAIVSGVGLPTLDSLAFAADPNGPATYQLTGFSNLTFVVSTDGTDLTATDVSLSGASRVVSLASQSGDLNVLSVNADATGTVLLDAGTGGQVLDGNGSGVNNVTAQNLSATAGDGITLDTAVQNLSFVAMNSGGAVNIANNGALNIAAVPAGPAVSVAQGGGSISASSPLTISMAVNLGAGMTFTANNSAAAGDDLTIAAAITLNAAASQTIALVAGDDVVFNGGSVTTTGAAHTVEITADAEGDLGVTDGDGGTVTQIGATLSISSSLLDISAPRGVGDAGQSLLTMVDSLTVDTSGDDGNQFIQESDGVSALDLNAGAGNVTLVSTTGSIEDADGATDITAANVTLTATTGGIGAAGALQTTTTGNLSFNTGGAGAAGNIAIVEANPLSTSRLAFTTAGDTQSISFTATTGDFTVNQNLGNSADDLSITVVAGNIVGTAGQVLTANNLSLTANSAAAFIGTSAIPVEVSVAGNFNASANIGAGGVFLSATGGLAVDTLNADTGDVHLTAVGAITSASAGPNVVGDELRLQAASVGVAGTPLMTMVATLAAQAITDGVFLINAGALIIGEIGGLLGVATLAGGSIDVRTSNGTLTVTETVSANGAGNVDLRAGGSSSDLVVTAADEVLSGTGNINLRAGRAVSISDDVQTGGGGMISVTTGTGNTGVLTLANGAPQNGRLTTVNGQIIVSADDVVLENQTLINAGNGRVTIRPADNTDGARGINLGANVMNSLGLTESELDRIQTTGVVQIGDTFAGSVLLSASITPNNFSTLRIESSGSLTTDDEANEITIANLAISVDGSIGFSTDRVSTDVTQIAARSEVAGDIFLAETTGGVTVALVDGVNGISTTASDIDMTVDGDLTVDADIAAAGGGNVTLVATGNIVAGPGRISTGSGLVTLNAVGIGTTAAPILTNLGSGTLSLTTSGVGAAGNIAISNANLALGLSTLQIVSISTFIGSLQEVIFIEELGNLTVDGNVNSIGDNLTLRTLAGNIVGGAGTAIGNDVDLIADAGDIGSGGSPVSVQVNSLLNISATGAGNRQIHVTSAFSLAVGSITTGVSNDTVSISTTVSAPLFLTNTAYNGLTGDDITLTTTNGQLAIANLVPLSAATISLVTTNGFIQVTSPLSTTGGLSVTNTSGAPTGTIFGPILGAGGLTKSGTGTISLTNTLDDYTYTGQTIINGGTLLVIGDIVGAGGTVEVNDTGTLGGRGTVDRSVNVQTGGTLAPGLSPGVFTINGDLFFADDSTYRIEINGTLPGNMATNHDQLVVNGSVTLGNSAGFPNLEFTFNGFVPNPGDQFVIVANDLMDPVLSADPPFNPAFLAQLDALPAPPTLLGEGAQITNFGALGQNARITYAGGTGNDIVITVEGGTVVVPGTNGDDQFTIRRNGANIEVYVGAVLFDARSIFSGHTIQIDGLAGDDTLTVIPTEVDLGVDRDFRNDFTGSIVFNGGGDDDTLELIGIGVGTDTFQFVQHDFNDATDGSITIDRDGAMSGGPFTVAYNSVDNPIEQQITVFDLTLNYNDDPNSITLAAGDPGRTTAAAAGAAPTLDFDNPLRLLAVNAGMGDDTVDVNSLGSGFSASLAIDGEDGAADVVTIATALNLGSLVSAGNLNLTAETINLNNPTINTDQGTNAGSVVLTGNVVLGANVAIDTDHATAVDGNLTVTGTILADVEANARTLSFTSGGGNISLQDQVGGPGQRLDSVTVNSANDVTFAAAVLTTGDVTQTAGTGTTTFNGGAIGGALDVTTDSIALNTASVTTTGLINLVAQNAISLNAGAGLNATAATISINANQDNADAEGFTQVAGTLIQTTNESTTAVTIDVDGSGHAALAQIQAGTTTGRVSATVGGSITDNNAAALNITAIEALLVAGNGIGGMAMTADLDTSVARLEAQAGSGGVFLANQGTLQIGDVDAAVTGVSATGGGIVVRTVGGNLTVVEAVTNTGAASGITLTAAGADVDLTINSPVTSNGGQIELNATGDVNLNNADADIASFMGGGDAGLIDINADTDRNAVGSFVSVADASVSSNATGADARIEIDSADFQIDTTTFTIDAGTSVVHIAPTNNGGTPIAISLGGGVAGFGVSDAELGRVSADRVEIGYRTATADHVVSGGITIDGDVSPAGTNTLVLNSGADINDDSDAAVRTITVANLALNAVTGIGNTNVFNLETDVLVARVTGIGGSMVLRELTDVNLDSVTTDDGAIEGLTTQGGAVTLDTDAGNLTSTTAGRITTTDTSGTMNSGAVELVAGGGGLVDLVGDVDTRGADNIGSDAFNAGQIDITASTTLAVTNVFASGGNATGGTGDGGDAANINLMSGTLATHDVTLNGTIVSRAGTSVGANAGLEAVVSIDAGVAGGALIDGDDTLVDIDAGGLVVRATGIGAGAAVDDVLETRVDQFAASIGAGGIELQNAVDLEITEILLKGMTPIIGVTTANADAQFDVNGSITINRAANVGNAAIRLIARGDVAQSALGTITAQNLGIRQQGAAGNVTLGFDNDVDVLAVFNQATGGMVDFHDTDELTIGSVAGHGAFTATDGLTTTDGDALADVEDTLSITQAVDAGTGTVRLVAGNSITQTATGTITAQNVGIRQQGATGNVSLAFDNDVDVLAVLNQAAGGTVDFHDIDDLTIGSVTGRTQDNAIFAATDGLTTANGDALVDVEDALSITQTVNVGTATVRIAAEDSITQNAAGTITAQILGIRQQGASGNVTLGFDNDVDVLAVLNQAAGGTVDFHDTDGLTIGSVIGRTQDSAVFAATDGLTTTDGDALVDVEGTLDITQAVSAGTGVVRIAAQGDVMQNAAGTITAQALGVRQQGAAGDVMLAFDNDVNVLAVANLATGGMVDFHDADGLTIGSVTGRTQDNAVFAATSGLTTTDGDALVDVEGTLNITQAVSAGTAIVRIAAENSVTQTAAGTITAQNLGVRQQGASGDITLAFNNDVDVLAATNLAAGGMVDFHDTDDLTIAAVTGRTKDNAVFADTTGLTTANGDALIDVEDTLSITQAVNAGIGTVRIAAQDSVSQTATGTITAQSLGVRQQGATGNVTLGFNNDVDVLAVLNQATGGMVDFHDVDDLTIGSVTGRTQDNAVFAATTGLATTDGDALVDVEDTLSINQAVSAGTGTVRLAAQNNITQTAAGTITAQHLGVRQQGAAGNITLGFNNDVDVLGVLNNAAGGTVDFHDTDDLTIDVVTGRTQDNAVFTATTGLTTTTGDALVDVEDALSITQQINVGAATVRIAAGSSITQDAAGTIIAQNLGIRQQGAAGNVTLGFNNDVDVLAVLNQATGGTVDFHDTDDLTIGSVAGRTQDNAVFAATDGLTTNNGDALLDVEDTLNITQAVDAGTGTVRIVAQDSVMQTATGTITAQSLGVRQQGGIGNVTLGFDNDVDVLAVLNLAAGGMVDFHDTDDLTIGSVTGRTQDNAIFAATDGLTTTGGDALVDVEDALDITQAVNVGAATVRIAAQDDITQNASGTITAQNLGIRQQGAAGHVTLGFDNDVDVVSILNQAAGGTVDFHDTDDLTIDAVMGRTQDNAVFAATTGLTTANGDALVDVEDSLSITQAIDAGTATVRIAAQDSVTQNAAGTIAAQNLGIRQQGATGNITLGFDNDVDVLAVLNQAAGGTVDFHDTDELTIGAVAGRTQDNAIFAATAGLLTTGGDALVDVEDTLSIVQAVNVGAATVRVAAQDSVTQNAAGTITAQNLGIRQQGATGNVTLGFNNDVDVLAVLNQAAGGTVAFNDIDDLTIAEVTARTQDNAVFALTIGATTSNGDALFQAGGFFDIDRPLNVGAADARIIAQGDVTQDALGQITADELGVRQTFDDGSALTGVNVVLDNPANDVNVLAVENQDASGSVAFRDADDLTIGEIAAQTIGPISFALTTGVSTSDGDALFQAGGFFDIDRPLDVGTADARIMAQGDVTQDALGQITADELGVRINAGDLLLDNADNDVNTLAALNTADQGRVHFRDVDELIIGTVTRLESDTIVFEGGLPGSHVVGLDTHNGDVLLETGTTLAINQAIDTADAVDTARGDVRIVAGGNVTQATAGTITGDELGVRTTVGDILLDNANNDVNTLAALNTAATGRIHFRDVDDLIISTVTASTSNKIAFEGNASMSDVIGLDTNNGDVLIQAGTMMPLMPAVPPALAINQAINTADAGDTARGDVRIVAFNSIAQAMSGAITADELGVRINAGDLLLDNADNDVNTLAALNTVATGRVHFRDVDDLIIGTVAEFTSNKIVFEGNALGSDVVGLDTNNGDVLIQAGTPMMPAMPPALAINQAIDTASAGDTARGDVRITAGGSVTQDTPGTITADQLGVRITVGNLLLDNANNDVNTLAALNTAETSEIRFLDVDDLIIGTVTRLESNRITFEEEVAGMMPGIDVVGLRTENGDISVTTVTAALSVQNDIRSTGGHITLTAQNGNLEFGAFTVTSTKGGTGDGRINGYAGTSAAGNHEVFIRDAARLETDTGSIGQKYTGFEFQANNAATGVPVTIGLNDTTTGAPIRVFVPGVSTVDQFGNTTVLFTLFDPWGVDFRIHIDWGDGQVDRFPDHSDDVRPFSFGTTTPQPQANSDSQFNSQQQGGQQYVLVKRYDGNPDPLNPRANILVMGWFEFNPLDEPGTSPLRTSEFENGIELFENGTSVDNNRIDDDRIIVRFEFELVVPGAGLFGGARFIETQVRAPSVAQQVRVETPPVVSTPPTSITRQVEEVDLIEEVTETEESQLILIVVDVEGNEGEPIQLDLELLEGERLLELLRQLPNGRYRVKFKAAGGIFQQFYDLKVDQGRLTDVSEEGSAEQDGSGGSAAVRRDAAQRLVIQSGGNVEPVEPAEETVGRQESAAAGQDVLVLPQVPAEFLEAALQQSQREASEAISRWRLSAPVAGGALLLGGLAYSGPQEDWKKRVDRALEAGRRSFSKASLMLRRSRR